MKKLLWVIVLVLVVGAVAYAIRSGRVPLPVPWTGQPPGNAAPASSPIPSAASSSLPAIDETWKTYTSRAGDFIFQWPTRGRYAPTWKAFFNDKDCAAEASTATFTANGVTFCHASLNEGAAGSAYFTDEYRTKHGSSRIVLSFTKRVYSADALGCSFVTSTRYSTSATGCIAFNETDYKTLLDQIVSTFKYIGN